MVLSILHMSSKSQWRLLMSGPPPLSFTTQKVTRLSDSIERWSVRRQLWFMNSMMSGMKLFQPLSWPWELPSIEPLGSPRSFYNMGMRPVYLLAWSLDLLPVSRQRLIATKKSLGLQIAKTFTVVSERQNSYMLRQKELYSERHHKISVDDLVWLCTDRPNPNLNRKFLIFLDRSLTCDTKSGQHSFWNRILRSMDEGEDCYVNIRWQIKKVLYFRSGY